ncbi:MAG: hypothetical protein JWO38_2040 [Gemmataceae bacterium]|nr:hypothetical protein [Gemmataceae bacterium]
MTEIRVASLFGPVCVSSEDGVALNVAIRQSLDRGEPVALDFTGVKTLASVFLNAAVGSLYASYDHGLLEDRVRWSGLSAANDSVMRLVRRNAVTFYAAPKPERDALASAAGGEAAAGN